MKPMTEKSGLLKGIKHFSSLFSMLLLINVLSSCLGPTYVAQTPAPEPRREVTSPDWAPSYDNESQVHYYYMPDIEVYYDVWNREYVYLDNGNWVFSTYLPPMYSSYDMNNSFVVVLDNRVSQPWRQHQLYVSHYPRYYYQSVYVNNNNEKYVRGFDENKKNAIYRSNNSTNARRDITNPTYNQPARRVERNTPEPNRRVSEPTKSPEKRYTEEPRNNNSPNRNVTIEPNNNQQRSNTQRTVEPQHNNTVTEPAAQKHPDNRSNVEPRQAPSTQSNTQGNQNENQRRAQPAVYTGKTVGKPVKVDRTMRQPASTSNQNNNQKDKKTNDNERR
jgi:hypothetical protein